MPIHQLPPLLANQIAAGEVIERPASVVKELVENSLDVSATSIEIDIERGGHQAIMVRDNGSGIRQAELPLAIARHATSKIATSADLEHIASLGFRGEALASIAAVSRLTLISRHHTAETGWQIAVEGVDAQLTEQPSAHPVGTTVRVHDLFFNVPARRKFLKSERSEFERIDALIKCFALSAFETQFVLKHNGKTVRQFPAATDSKGKEKRIGQILGQPFLEASREIDAAITDYALSGWVGLPQYARSQTDQQYFFLNGRMIRDKLILHAIRQAYVDKLYPGRYGAFVLFLRCDPNLVDVNVHPTKHEVRFRAPSTVHDFVLRCIESALTETRKTTREDSENFLVAAAQFAQSTASRPGDHARSDAATPSATTALLASDTVLPYGKPEDAAFVRRQFSSAYRSRAASEAAIFPGTQTEVGRYVGMAHDRYLIFSTGHKLSIYDATRIFSAARRIPYLAAIKDNEVVRRSLLLPQTLTLTDEQNACFEENAKLFATLGFTLQSEGHYLTLREQPTFLGEASAHEWLLLALSEAAQTIEILADSLIAFAASHQSLTATESVRLLASLSTEARQQCCRQTVSLAEHAE